MPTLKNLLNSSNDSWTPIEGYPVDTNYKDDYEPVEVSLDRNIGQVHGVTTYREVDAQYITFQIPRYPDGYDLCDTKIRIYYERTYTDDQDVTHTEGDDIVPINVVANDTSIVIGWVIPLELTQRVGEFNFIIQCHSTLFK